MLRESPLRESPLRGSLSVDPVASPGAAESRNARSGSSGMGWLGETGAGGFARGASYCAHAGPAGAPSPISSAAMFPALKKINRPSLQTANNHRTTLAPSRPTFDFNAPFFAARQRVTVLVSGTRLGTCAPLPSIPRALEHRPREAPDSCHASCRRARLIRGLMSGRRMGA
jgi:hypothetical protein